MEVDLQAELGEDGHGHKRTDLEETTEGRVANGGGGDAKRPREDLHRRRYMEMWDDDDEDDWSFPPNPLDAYRKTWIWLYGASGASFEDETERPPMRHTDGPVLPPSAQPMDTMQVFYVKVTQIAGALQWPLDVYGVVAVRDSLDHKRNILFRRGRDECQTLTSLQRHGDWPDRMQGERAARWPDRTHARWPDRSKVSAWRARSKPHSESLVVGQQNQDHAVKRKTNAGVWGLLKRNGNWSWKLLPTLGW